MVQLSLFGEGGSLKDKKQLWQLYIDGASRNNPGLAGAGIYILKDNKSFLKQHFFLGEKTNNQAEYLSLLLGLFLLEPFIKEDEGLEIFSDSQLLVRQIQGAYKIKDPELKKLWQIAVSFLNSYAFKANYIERTKNSIADALANKGIDLQKKPLPKEFKNFYDKYTH